MRPQFQSKTTRTAPRVPQPGKQAKPRSVGVDGVGTVLTEPPLLRQDHADVCYSAVETEQGKVQLPAW